MDMPTPCPLCGDITGFDDMQFVDGELCCEECHMQAHVCDWCENLVSEVRYYEDVSLEDDIYAEMELCEECGRNEVQ